MKLIRLFLEFEKNDVWNGGFGVTAWTKDDALNLVQEKVFKTNQIPNLREIEEINSLDQLDPGHVIPNMEEHISRGIWYPLGYK